MTLENDAKFDEKLICFKNDTNLVKLDPVSKIALSFVPIVQSIYTMFDLKKYGGVIFHETEEWWKIWRKTELWFGRWHEEYGKLSPEHLKVSKLGFWWDPLIQNRKSMCLKFIEELCIITMKNDAKFEKELTCRFKIVSWQIWEILTQALESLKNFHFNAILLSKIYIVWDKKVQRSYLLWHWKGIQNLEKNRLVLSNLT